MSDGAWIPTAGEAASHDLTRRAVELAVRIAALLEDACTEGSGGSAAAGFLRSYATAAMSVPASPATTISPIDALVERCRLNHVELQLVLLAGLADEHEGVASTLRALHPRGEPCPTVGLAAQLLTPDQTVRATLRRILAEGAATRLGIVDVGEHGAFYEASLRLADRLWDALHGHDGAWPSSLERIWIDAVPPPGLEAWIDQPGVRRVEDAIESCEDRTILLTAADETIAASRVSALAAAASRAVVAARLESPDPSKVALLAVHAACRMAVPAVFLRSPPEGMVGSARALELDACPGPLIVCAPAGAVRPVGERPVVTVPMGPLSTPDRRRGWQIVLPDLAELAPELAARHPLDPALTSEVAADVRSRRRLAGGLDGVREISEVIRARAGVTLPPGARMTAPDVDWDRLVLPEDALLQLRDAVARLRFQATVLDDWEFLEQARADRGVRVMLTGPPGTGKSLAAEVVAAAAGTDLLVVDVSQVVSKWIGETEKNLAGLFDVAERMQAVLFLDEADALFASRTEVSDAHDRYANLQTAYLLQRLDHFDGLTVLATNLRQNIDAAFLRRMDVVVEFSVPDVEMRRLLWALHLPDRAPRADDVDLGMLAQLYPVPGAWIRNSAIGAAFLAATDGSPIGLRHLVRAMRREYDKASRPFPGEPALVGARRSQP